MLHTRCYCSLSMMTAIKSFIIIILRLILPYAYLQRVITAYSSSAGQSRLQLSDQVLGSFAGGDHDANHVVLSPLQHRSRQDWLPIHNSSNINNGYMLSYESGQKHDLPSVSQSRCKLASLHWPEVIAIVKVHIFQHTVVFEGCSAVASCPDIPSDHLANPVKKSQTPQINN